MKNAKMYTLILGLIGLTALPWVAFTVLPLALIMLAFVPIFGLISLMLPNRGKSKDKFRNRRVLLVDDEPTSLYLITRILRRENCDFEIATSGKSAIEALKKNDFDLIFLDYNMPDMNGAEMLVGAESALSKKTKTPVVFFSGDHIECDDFRSMHNFNMVEALTKQMPTMLLEQKINEFVHGKSAQIYF